MIYLTEIVKYMFTISTKGSYGLAAVFELGKHYHMGSVTIKKIADSQAIPRHYLEQILIKLRQGGILSSTRGAEGGYALARDPSDVTVFEVLSCLEGEKLLVSNPGDELVLQFFWRDAREKIESIFTVTIEELIQRQQLINNQIVFSI